MGGSGTLGNSQGSCSTTASDSSTVKIKALFYFDAKPTFSASDGKLKFAEGDLPHFVRLRNDISYKQFKKIVCSLSPTYYDFSSYNICYYLPGQGLMAFKTEEDMKNMIEEFNELNRIQEPQMLKIQQENVARSNDCKMEHDQVSKPQWINECLFLTWNLMTKCYQRNSDHVPFLLPKLELDTCRMEGSGTVGKSQASYSITSITSDSSTEKIKALFYFGRNPKFSEGDGKVRIPEGRLPHLVRLRNDISYEQFQKIINSRTPYPYLNFTAYNISYYLPGHGLIALKTEEDMKDMIEEFDELNRIQEPQMLKVFVDW
ncbi:hypothetical protein FNV43_RR19722 [Rhamnella rubrinervis]|uniref:PB1 domain-containing protein n=1 Tax=Rhamnella rubrinervis TaxID=2594499 RepID=A0A8K0DZS4_9ROSA|nr:hypothetical protein FNV43_RR19722 [Rhamnella rubrinervis]